jgi:hypothetical protein
MLECWKREVEEILWWLKREVVVIAQGVGERNGSGGEISEKVGD